MLRFLYQIVWGPDSADPPARKCRPPVLKDSGRDAHGGPESCFPGERPAQWRRAAVLGSGHARLYSLNRIHAVPAAHASARVQHQSILHLNLNHIWNGLRDLMRTLALTTTGSATVPSEICSTTSKNDSTIKLIHIKH